MTEPDDPKWVSLAEAARAAEDELERFEALVASIRKIDLNSEKSILHAGKVLSEAVSVQARIAEVLSPLARAFSRAQQRELAAAEHLQACAERIHERTEMFASLMEGVRALGSDAIEVTVLLRSAAAGDDVGDFGKRVADAAARMDAAVTRAKELHQRAREAGLNDVARQAESLEQQLVAARGKLKHGAKSDLTN